MQVLYAGSTVPYPREKLIPYILIYIIYLPAVIAKYANVLASILSHEFLALENNGSRKEWESIRQTNIS